MRHLKRLLLATLSIVVLVVAIPLLGQQAPTFKSGVELIVIDVTVVDKTGRPIRDLKPSDFTVSIDGKPRTIASAHYQDYGATGTTVVERVGVPAPAPPPAATPAPSQGRSVLIVVDTDSMEPVVGLEFKQAAYRFLDTLGPNDRVGVVTIPRVQSEIFLSTDREAARQVIDGVVTGINQDIHEFNIGIAEAMDIERGDPNLAQQVEGRECRSAPSDGSCAIRVQMQIRQMQLDVHLRAQRSLDALFDIADNLSAVQGPKTMLLVSGGMGMPDLRSVSMFSRVGEMFAAGQVTLYTLYMERSSFGQVRNTPSPTPSGDDLVFRDGIENVTSVTGGTLMLGIGTIDQYFARVLTELTGSYLLGVEVASADKDGKPHRVQVKSLRSDIEIRARKEYVIGSAPRLAIKVDGGSLGATAVEHMLMAGRDLETRGEIGVRASARYSPYARGGAGEVVVQATIDPRTLYLVTMDGRRMGRLALGIFVGREKRAAADSALWEEMKLALSEESYQRFKTSGIPYTAKVPASIAPRYVKLVVYEYRSGSVGAATTKIK